MLSVKAWNNSERKQNKRIMKEQTNRQAHDPASYEYVYLGEHNIEYLDIGDVFG